MIESTSSITILFIATMLAYLLGALPLADRISRRHGVDIFSTGTRLAGASNVRKNVGKVPGALVMAGDMSKGALTIIGAKQLGIEGSWVLVPAIGAILGQWHSVFTGFRGGDGLAILGGIIVASYPVLGFISLVIAAIVSLGAQKMPYSSLLSIVFGYGALVILTTRFGQPGIILGIGGLAALVLARAMLHGQMRRHREDDWSRVRG